MRYKSWSACVCIGDPLFPETSRLEVLPEYLPNEPLIENTLIIYIPVQERKEFFVTVVNEDICDARVFVYVDGQVASYPLCYAAPGPNALNCVGYQSAQQGYLRKFVFQKAPRRGVALPEIHSLLNDQGVIRVVVRRCAVYPNTPNDTAWQRGYHNPQDALVVAANRSYASPYSRHEPLCRYLDDRAWVQFIFVYRSIESLQAFGLTTRAQPLYPYPHPMQQQERGLSSPEDASRRQDKRLRSQSSRLRVRNSELKHPSGISVKTEDVFIKKEDDLS